MSKKAVKKKVGSKKRVARKQSAKAVAVKKVKNKEKGVPIGFQCF